MQVLDTGICTHYVAAMRNLSLVLVVLSGLTFAQASPAVMVPPSDRQSDCARISVAFASGVASSLIAAKLVTKPGTNVDTMSAREFCSLTVIEFAMSHLLQAVVNGLSLQSPLPSYWEFMASWGGIEAVTISSSLWSILRARPH